MGAIRTSATALLSAGATGAVLALGALAAPAAAAPEAGSQQEQRQTQKQKQKQTSFRFTLTPSTVAPGGQVVLGVTGCNAAYATASSGVFDTVSIERGRTVRVTVDRDARRGALYSVAFTCNGETGSADLTIAGGTARPTTSSTRTAPVPPPPPPPPPPSTFTSTATAGAPVVIRPPSGAATSARGVRGGLGGSVAGMDPLELGAGAGLFLAAAGGTAYALRRRRSAHGRSH